MLKIWANTLSHVRSFQLSGWTAIHTEKHFLVKNLQVLDEMLHLIQNIPYTSEINYSYRLPSAYAANIMTPHHQVIVTIVTETISLHLYLNLISLSALVLSFRARDRKNFRIGRIFLYPRVHSFLNKKQKEKKRNKTRTNGNFFYDLEYTFRMFSLQFLLAPFLIFIEYYILFGIVNRVEDRSYCYSRTIVKS